MHPLDRHHASSKEARKIAIKTGGALLTLLLLVAATCWASYQPLGSGRLAVGLGIAACKIALIAWLFMRLGDTRPVIKLAVALVFLTVTVLFGLSAADYLGRANAPSRYQQPAQIAPISSNGAPRLAAAHS